MQTMAKAKLNADVVKALPAPEFGNKVWYFPDAVLQGAKAPRGFGVRVTAAGVRSFIINYRVAHSERRLTIGQHPDWSVLRAVKAARELRQRIDRGEDPLADRRKAKVAAGDTLQAICEEYLTREGPKLRSKDWREAALQRLVYPELGKKSIGAIKRSDIVNLLDDIEDESGPVMADRTLAVVRKIMNWHAARSDDFNSPIVRGMARTNGKERARKRTLSDAELRVVWQAAEAMEGPFGAYVQFVLLTATRRNEAARAQRSEISGTDWTIPSARYKTKLDHLIPLPDAARTALANGSSFEDCDFLFTTDGETPISGFGKFKEALDAKVLEQLREQDSEAEPLPGWRLHDLRRTARTLLSRARIPVQEPGAEPRRVVADIAERCMGHIMGAMRANYDVYDYRDEKAEAFEALAELIKQIVSPSASAERRADVTPPAQGERTKGRHVSARVAARA
jgi:integrase